ncbi:MAG: Crp/Fnr family transcriptional regulator [Cyclobacteriaceae bacterium]|nr:Crp/Fnr family transcriptional regulator [Cyclobacteriaceae bacterium HetDA_MAG_MS6]
MKNIIQYINQYVKLSSDEEQDLLKECKTREVEKGHDLHTPGTIAKHFYFIESGIARIYYYQNGNDITDFFAIEGEFIGTLDSLFTGKTSLFGIHVLEKSKLLQIKYEALERLYDRYHTFEKLGRILATKGYLEEVARTKTFQGMNAEERYELLVKTEPHLLQRAPLGHIASYLGISQVQLSRIRSKKNAF